MSFISSDLGSPSRSVTATGYALDFFKTNNPLVKGITKNHSFVLNANLATVGNSLDVKILGYANDNIYGVGKPPVGSPPSTLTGGIDFANSTYSTGSSAFPDNIIATTDLTPLPFTGATIGVIPFDITKTESGNGLIGSTITTTLTITNNNLGALKNIHIQDIIPENRQLISFTQTGGVGNIAVTEDAPSAGKTKIDFKNIAVAQGATLNIIYQTLALSHNVLDYASGSLNLNPASPTSNGASSNNIATPHTGGLASGTSPSTWNNGSSDILITSSTLPSQKTHNTPLKYATIAKSVSKSNAVIGDTLTYTIDIDIADNVDFTTDGPGTYIDDILPDGLTFSGVISSLITAGSGTPFSFSGVTTDINGDSTIQWHLPSGIINAGSHVQIKYQAILDGAFE